MALGPFLRHLLGGPIDRCLSETSSLTDRQLAHSCGRLESVESRLVGMIWPITIESTADVWNRLGVDLSSFRPYP
jgi:hypothetical protein